MQKHRLMYMMLVWLMIVSLKSTGFAQQTDVPLQFPTTADDIESFFLKNKPVRQDAANESATRGLQTKGIKRVVEDKVSVDELPTVGAMVLFEFDSATIKDDSYELLDEFAVALKRKLHEASVVIKGHTDDIGPDGYNYELSERRALAVKEFLEVRHDIEPGRLSVKPYGESQPITPNTTQEQRALNRRVEFSCIW